MKVLLVNKFVHHVGGVETYLRWLALELQGQGVEVGLLGMSPPEGKAPMDLGDIPVWLTPGRSYASGASNRIQSAATSVWSTAAAKVMRKALAEFSPDLVHFHGSCFQLTPSVVREVTEAGVPVVLTAHEYKLACANQILYDQARRSICTLCVGAGPVGKVLNPIRQGCIKGSRAVSAIGGIEAPIARRVWQRADPYVLAPSRFMRERLIEDGWNGERIEYLDLAWRSEKEQVSTDHQIPGDSIAFLGRLAPYKGVDVLLRAWRKAAPELPDVHLRIMGEGDDREELEEYTRAHGLPRVTFLGYCDRKTIEVELRRALATAHPSQCHENSPYSVRESLMAGTPAIVGSVGGMPEMVEDQTGWVVPFDDEDAWAKALVRAAASRREGTPELREQVADRAVTHELHLRRVLEVYREQTRRDV